MKRIMSFVAAMFLLALPVSIHAQGLEITEPISLTSRQEAVNYERTDLNGERCALLIMHFDNDNVDFEGDIRSTQYRGNGEWWIWLIQDANWLTVKTAQYTPFRMEFKPLKSGKTYEMTLSPATPQLMLTVTEPFHADITMTDATKFSRVDADGRTCALVRMGMVLPEAKFEGSGVVHSVYRGGEWWVWLSPEATQLTVKAEGYQPLELQFEPVMASVTYLVTIFKAGQQASQAEEQKAPVYDGYVDLGLPSGTLWSKQNEAGFYSYDSAMAVYGKDMPTHDQLEELMSVCEWNLTDRGYEVVGPNGNSIVLPLSGTRKRSDRVEGMGKMGSLWSSTPSAAMAWLIEYSSISKHLKSLPRTDERPVRLVKSK